MTSQPSMRSADQRLWTWFYATRPQSFSATFAPVSLGLALAWQAGHFNLFSALVTLLAALLLQAGANLVNEYMDYRKGADSTASIAPSRVIRDGLLTPHQVWMGAWVSLGAGALLGIGLAWMGGWPVWVIGALGVLSAVLYTAGPLPFAYVGLGEVVVFLAMGPGIVAGTYAVQTQTITFSVLLAAVPIGLLVAAILHANNLRDLDHDRSVGKRTVATRLGRRGAQIEYLTLAGGAFVAVPVSVVVGALPPSALVVGILLPQLYSLIHIAFSREDMPSLNTVLRQTAALHLRFGLLLAASVVIWNWVAGG
ncbi:MAG: 1,4-dihydroxy-2-naphthoate octaprenyltransferase [Anaerolineae bacterium]|nr:1,4-dihydroxy-2-naphthoate octaprenyltransferase [Thermoflexales bacterium]MDW8408331.1 1,4-dihydroxy-2-naphthoate octaprenyltransferase [Anaerolineae bacterium]